MKQPFPHAAAAAALLRAGCPRDASIPIYIMSAQDTGAGPPTKGYRADNWAAYTSASLDTRHKQYLQRHGVWRGRGFASIWRDDAFCGRDKDANFEAGLGLLVHEFAHHLVGPDTPKFFVGDRTLRAFNRERCRRHGAQFLRAAIHIHHRVSPQFQVLRRRPLDLSLVSIAGEYHHASSSCDYRLTLGRELNSTLSVTQVLDIAPPRPFAQLWCHDFHNPRHDLS